MQQEQKQQHSRLFTPYRAIGSITDGAPFGINRLGDVTFITTTVGNAFQVFEADKLRIAIVAPPLLEGGNVVGVQAQKSRTFVATERCIQVWDRVTLVKGNLFAAAAASATTNDVNTLPKGSKVVALLLLGDVLLGLTSQGKLHVWDSRSLETVEGGSLSIEGNFRTGGVLVHPDTYLNKVLIGDGSGRLMLWNIRFLKTLIKGLFLLILRRQIDPQLNVLHSSTFFVHLSW
jgi:U3 small nucleolar RNA-associated protein 21